MATKLKQGRLTRDIFDRTALAAWNNHLWWAEGNMVYWEPIKVRKEAVKWQQ